MKYLIFLRNLIVFFVIFGMPVIANYKSVGFDSTIKIYFFYLGYIFCITSLLLIKNTKTKAISFISIQLSILFLLPLFVYTMYLIPWVTGNRGLTTDDVMAFLQTNPYEAYSYLLSNLNIYKFSASVFFIILYLGIIFRFFNTHYSFKNKHVLSILLKTRILLIAGILLIALSYNNCLFKPIFDSVPKIKEYRNFYSNLKKTEKPSLIKNSTQKGIYVIIIGESQNRKRMSVYGYDKDTTPFLDRNKNDKHWLFIKNAYSCHTHTIPTLTYALTQKNSYNDISLEKSYSITDILNEYNTYWISNQKAVGYFGEPITKIGLQTNHPIFINKSFTKKDPLDFELIQYLPLEENLKNQTSIIFIHLMGSHAPYENRYPQKYKKYSANYDNSISYNDYIVQKICEHFSKMHNFQALMYFSDHADDLNCACHDSSKFTWDMTRIPFYFYFSDKYIESNPYKMSVLRKHIKTPFTNDMIFDSILGLLNITDKRFYVQENDILSDKYNHSISDLATLHGKKKIIDDPENKFWLHRVNSPLKLAEFSEKYQGVEMDIIFHEKENDFENSHDISGLEQHRLSATLSEYQKQNRKSQIWFDFKNLTENNKEKALLRLTELLKEFNISKERCWIESPNYNALDSFTKDGWKTSYYFPYYEFEKMNESDIEKIKTETEKISFSQKIKAISFAGKYYSFVKKLNLNTNISLLTWFDGETKEEFLNRKNNLAIMEDPRIRIILIKDFGNFHR